MPARNKPYEQFGAYILFKKLETDALGDLWRAGRISGTSIGATVALRRLSGGNREALVAAATAAKPVTRLLSGTSFVRDQAIEVIDGTPVVAWDYAGGRTLRHIVDRSRGGNGLTPNPLPLDQAIVIAEKVALSLATTEDLRAGQKRLNHGALIPQFVWISDDGEIRVAGQQLGRGIVAALADAKVGADIGRYFAPEYRASGEVTKESEVFSLGAILYLLVTGQEPPDATTSSAFTQSLQGSKTAAGEPLPSDIRNLIDRSLTLDPKARFSSVADMKSAISAVAHSGGYSATTFNLAFYLSSLLKKEMEGEAIDRDRESKVNVAPYLEPEPAPASAPVAQAPAVPAPAPFAATSPLSQPAPQSKSKAPLAIAAVVLLALVGGGAFMMMSKSKTAPPAAVTSASAIPVSTPAPPQHIPEPILSTPASTDTAATATTGSAPDAEAQKKAFEDAVKQRLQQEVMKLQSEYTTQLQKQNSKNAPVPQPAAVAATPAESRPAPSAAQLDQQRLASRNDDAQAAAPVTVAPAPAQQPATQTVAPQVAAAPVIHEGDVVDVNSLDSAPKALRAIRPVYPPVAARQRIEGVVILSALISENGSVLDVKVLKGDGRFGLNESAIRALRDAKFSPAMKDGKRVKTWLPQPFVFKP